MLLPEHNRWSPRSARAFPAARAQPARSAGSTFRTRRGFTLVEVLMVLALLALVGAVLLPSAGALLRSGQSGNMDELVTEVMQEARRTAVLTGREVALRFEPDAQRFAWDGSARGLAPA